jgi:hypothetical protein
VKPRRLGLGQSSILVPWSSRTKKEDILEITVLSRCLQPSIGMFEHYAVRWQGVGNEQMTEPQCLNELPVSVRVILPVKRVRMSREFVLW